MKLREEICVNCNVPFEVEVGTKKEDSQLCPPCIIVFKREAKEDRINRRIEV